MATESALVAGAVVGGRYRIERELGRGGMAVVYLAHDFLDNRPVALKVLREAVVSALGPKRFLREIAITGGLRHPGILPLLDSGEDEGLLFYTMPYVDGETLRDRIHREGQLRVGEAIRITRDVLAALDLAHQRGIIHRDIKPSNILQSGDQTYVSDFGLARAIDNATDPESISSSGLVVGTPAYMSPEQAASTPPIDGRTDLYAVGCVLYEMLAGDPPFTGSSPTTILLRHGSQTAPSLRAVRPAVPESLDAAVHRALEKVPADRFATAAEFAAALEERPVAPPPRRRIRPLAAAAIVILIAIGAVVAKLSPWRPRPGSAPSLAAVLPFDVMVPGLDYWGEGLADLVARNLDGTGPLRALPPSAVVRERRGRLDPAGASELARRIGAGLAVLGQVFPSGRDSVRLVASVIDAATARRVADVEVREAQDRIDRAADSLSFRLLVALSPSRSAGGVHFHSVGPTTLPAMKAFLQGEYFYRRTAWDSAVVYYRRAIDQDSTFALAYLRLGRVVGWQSGAWIVAPLERAYALEAGRLNRGLAIRDSLVVAAESLRAAVVLRWDDSLFSDHRRRLFGLLEQAARRYPSDPEVWYELGVARVVVSGGGSAEEALDAFDRGIELDSTFAPAYLNPVEQSILVRGPRDARRYLSAYLALNPTDVHAEGLRLAELLLDPARSEAAVAERLRTASAEVLLTANDALGWWVDSGETAVRLARLAIGRRSASPLFVGPRPLQLATALAYRGHLSEALQVLADRARHPPLWTVLLTLGALPDDSTAPLLSQILKEPLWRPNGAVFAIPWWAAHRDTTALQVVAQRADSLARATSHPLVGPYARLLATSARAHLASVRGQADAVLSELRGWDESVCAGWDCYYMKLDRARLLAAHGREAAAADLLEAETPKLYYPLAVLWRLERARLAARQGRREQAMKDYRYVVDAWARADRPLLALVEEARAALDGLKAAR